MACAGTSRFSSLCVRRFADEFQFRLQHADPLFGAIASRQSTRAEYDGRAVPADRTAVPRAHLRQMAAYSAALSAIFPDREIRASLLYSAGPALIDLPEALLAPHKPGFVPAQEKL